MKAIVECNDLDGKQVLEMVTGIKWDHGTLEVITSIQPTEHTAYKTTTYFHGFRSLVLE